MESFIVCFNATVVVLRQCGRLWGNKWLLVLLFVINVRLSLSLFLPHAVENLFVASGA